MTTILKIRGWRIFFYSNEEEPIYVHAQKEDAECRVRLHFVRYDLTEEWAHGMTPRLRREVRQIIFEHFDMICDDWVRFFGANGDDEG
jgi:hypothetical protein